MSAPTPKEIRDCFQEYRDAWQTTRDEAKADMRALSTTGPWSDEDRDERRGSGRPCIHLDQLNQFISQVNGNARKSQRAVKAIPKGNGATDQDAQRRSALIMAIEDRSQAVPIYLGAFQSMTERSYGFSVLRTEYRDDESFDQEILVKPIQNPDSVLISPYYKQPNASDIEDGFLLDVIPKRDFKNKYPKARITDFSDVDISDAGITDWLKDKHVQVAEYWKIEYDLKKLLMIEMPDRVNPRQTITRILLEKLWEQQGKPGTVKRDREIQVPRVVQYMTNGLEILDDPPWAGSRIPIISCLGPERWTTEGGNARRELLSLVRFARDPQMMLDYLASGEAETAGKLPKTPFVGAKGQFESDKEAWDELHKVPHPYVQYDLVLDAGGQAAPPPTFENFTPQFDQWELAIDARTRSIQAAMGISPMPDAAQRRNQKSGVALEKIDDMEALGSFPFVDRYENGYLYNMGWQMNELIEPIMDTQRDMPVALPDGKRSTMQVVGNTSHPMDDKGAYDVRGPDGQPLAENHIHTGKGDFDVTISSGPSHASERQEQDEFVDQLIENIANIPQPGTPAAKILAMGIRMRTTLGPVGEQIATLLDPPDPSNLPPEAQAAIQGMKSQVDALTQENTALHMDRAGRVLEQQTKKEIEGMKAQNALLLKKMDQITQVIKAQLAAKSRSTDLEAQRDADKELALLGFDHDQIDRAHDAAHETALTQMGQDHAQDMASQAALQPQQEPAAQPGAGA